MDFNKNLSLIQKELKIQKIGGYLINFTDPHASEYVHPHFVHLIHSFSPFSGESATYLITQDEAYLFTDGRYFIQAERELKDSPIKLMKMGEPHVPTLGELINSLNISLAFDFSLISDSLFNSLKLKSQPINLTFPNFFPNEPALPADLVFELPLELSGETREDKIARLLTEMEKVGASSYLVTRLDEIAWILNYRGFDVESVMVFYSYLLITHDSIILFADKNKFTKVDTHGLTILPYDSITDYLKEHKLVHTLVDNSALTVAFKNLLIEPIITRSPANLMKAIKNKTEIENIKNIHMFDGLSVVRFLSHFYQELKNKTPLDEYHVGLELEQFRKTCSTYIEPSFASIVAYGANGAQMHYSASPTVYSKIVPTSSLLIDSGGHYLGGTTDITRTFHCGETSEEFKHHYTLTLKSLINLTTSKFIYGSNGMGIDIKAREIMWKEGLDYKCGTGHGVGYMLSVHEGPNGFRYKKVPERDDGATMEPGMITTIEPGVYREFKYGIRLENELLCVDDYENDMGRFMKFETITLCPFDRTQIDLSILSDEEISWINEYHEKVLLTFESYLNDDELEFINNATAPLVR